MVEILDTVQMLGENFEPKRKFRWILSIDGIDAFTLKTASRPTMTTDSVEMGFINNTRYVAGKTKPGTTSITLYDSINPSAAQKVMEWVKLHYDGATGRAAYQQYYKKDITLKVLDPIGAVIEQWSGYGAFITETNFGDLDYTAGDPLEIAMTLQADRWILEF